MIKFIGNSYAYLAPEHEKGKLCESRGRKVTDLKDLYPKMAGLPDNAYRKPNFEAHLCSSVLVILKEELK